MLGIEPQEICAGDSVTWTRFVDGYPSGQNWGLSYFLQLSGSPIVRVDATADPDGQSFDVTIPAVATAVWPAGQYAWKAVLFGSGPNAGQRITVDQAELVVLPDPTQTYDSRSHFRKCYEAITAVLEGRMGDPIVRYKIGDTEAQKIPHWDLLKLQAYYASRLRTEAGRPLVTIHPVVLR